MKKILAWFGGLCLALLLLTAGSIAVMACFGRGYDAESKACVEKANQAILADWSVAELQQRQSPELQKAVNTAQLAGLLDRCRAGLGGLRSAGEPKGEANINLLLNQGVQVTARYDTAATFERGTATVRLTLIRHGGVWQILGFFIENVNVIVPPEVAAPAPAD